MGKKVRKRGGPATPTGASKNKPSHSHINAKPQGLKGHAGGRRRSLMRDCCLIIVSCMAPIAIMESFNPDETNSILRKISDKLMTKLGRMEEDAAAMVSSSSNLRQVSSSNQISVSNQASSPNQISSKQAPHPIQHTDKTIAYVVPFFADCHDEYKPFYKDAGLILRHSIHLQSSRTPSSGSEYDYQMYALTVKGKNCPNEELEALGYKVHQVESPIQLDKIQNEYVRNNIPMQGDGGHLQFIQLLAHEIVEEPIFVIMFINSLLLQPLDDLYRAMQYPKSSPEGKIARGFLQPKLERPSDPLPEEIHHFFVRNYPNTGYGRKPVVYQPGFLVARKHPLIVQQVVDLVYEGNHIQGNSPESGWGGKGYSMYFKGGLVMPGLLAYYLDVFHANTSVELSSCKFNHNGMDNRYRNAPRFHPSFKDHIGKCRSGEAECGDCTTTDVELIFTILYDEQTCYAPWKCYGEGEPGGAKKTKINTQVTTVDHCLTLQKAWHTLRFDIEQTLIKDGADSTVKEGRRGQFESYTFQGHCLGHNLYWPMAMSKETAKRIPELLWGDF